jgi:hypothetical protein
MPQEGQYRVNRLWSGGHSGSDPDPRCLKIIDDIIAIWPHKLISARIDFVYDNGTPLIMEVETVNPGFGFKVEANINRCMSLFMEALRKYGH